MQFRHDMVVSRRDEISRNNGNAARHGESAQQQQAWNKLHFRRVGYALG
jgi:hypothetical protein